MATQPMNIVLITVTSMTSPRTRYTARIMGNPEQNGYPENGGAAWRPTPNA